MTARVLVTALGCLTACADQGELVYLGTGAQQVSSYEDDADKALLDALEQELNEYFHGVRRTFDLPCRAVGSAFRTAVWNALREIPYGETRTYGEIAAAIGRPKAARAVGGACHDNPLLILTPCHRVVGSDGNLTGFACGLDMKSALLKLEAAAIKNE